MADTFFASSGHKVSLTSYCGPAKVGNPIRVQVTVSSDLGGCMYNSLSHEEAIEMAKAILERFYGRTAD